MAKGNKKIPFPGGKAGKNPWAISLMIPYHWVQGRITEKDYS